MLQIKPSNWLEPEGVRVANSGEVSRGKTGNKKIKRIERNLGPGWSCITRWLLPGEFIKKYSILCTICRCKMGQSAEIYNAMGWKQQEADQAMLHRGTKDISSASQTEYSAALRLTTLVSSERKRQIPRNSNLNFFKVLTPNPDRTLPNLPLGKDTEETFHSLTLLSGHIVKGLYHITEIPTHLSSFLWYSQ